MKRPDENTELKDELNRLRLMVDGSRDYISLIDRNYVYRAVNRAYLVARDLAAGEIVGQSVRTVWGDDAFTRVIQRNLDRCFRGETVRDRASFDFRESERCVMDVTYYPCRNETGDVAHVVVVNHDITELVRKEEKLSRLAYFDKLTALPNRTQFLERLAIGIANARRSNESLAVFFIDLDDFKRVNDIHGHAAGDQLLREVATRLRGGLRETDTIGQTTDWNQGQDATINRLGGDEFTLVFPGVKKTRSLAVLAERVQRFFSAPFLIADTELAVACSIGISVFPDDGSDGETLVKHADLAMYRAKASGKNRYAFYNRTMSEQLEAVTDIEARLRKAIRSGDLAVDLQPKIDTTRNCVVGCEALARWTDPGLGPVPPIQFIPVAEEAGLIQALDLAVLAKACLELRRLHRKGFRIGMSVNYSTIHMGEDDLVERTIEVLRQTDYPPELLEIEITESAMIDNIDKTIAKLRRLRDHGVRIALDDFGTGFSSLTYLSRLPIDVLKLDRAFTTRLDHHNESAVLEGVTLIASRLGLTVVAEGVETQAQRDLLLSIGRPVMQGYYFSKPLSPGDFVGFLSAFVDNGGVVAA